MLTFREMEMRYGAVAYQYLQEIERAARILPTPALDPETRLRRAYQEQDAQAGGAVA